MTRPINPLYPVTELDSLEQLMDIAVTVEREAAARFDELAARLEAQGNGETAALFRELADEERGHEDEIARWATRDDHRAPRLVEYAWEMPETFELGDAVSGAATLTPYQALSVAVRNEERTFGFYTFLAAIARDDAVRRRAEALAKGELDHVSRLREKRRRAFHAEYRERPAVPARATSLHEVAQVAHGLEHGSAVLDARLATLLEQHGDTESASLLRQLAEAARTGADEALALAGTVGEAPSSNAAAAAQASGILAPGTLTSAGMLRLALKDAEEVAQRFLDMAEKAADQEVMHEAQRLGERTVARLALINTRLQDGGVQQV